MSSESPVFEEWKRAISEFARSKGYKTPTIEARFHRRLGLLTFSLLFLSMNFFRDEAILRVLYESGRGGILPKDIAYRLRTYGGYRQKVSGRVRGMNRRLRRELGRDVAEKQGYRWALTSFMFDVWGSSKEEIKNEPV